MRSAASRISTVGVVSARHGCRVIVKGVALLVVVCGGGQRAERPLCVGGAVVGVTGEEDAVYKEDGEAFQLSNQRRSVVTDDADKADTSSGRNVDINRTTVVIIAIIIIRSSSSIVIIIIIVIFIVIVFVVVFVVVVIVVVIVVCTGGSSVTSAAAAAAAAAARR
jgi:hypothetical protein